MSLQAAIEAIQDKILAISGIKAASDYPPENVNQFPFAVTYAASGTFNIATYGRRKGLHTIHCEVHFARANLPTAIELAMPYLESIPNALLADPKLNSTVDTINALRYSFGVLDWGGMKEAHIGFRLEIEVKIEEAIT